MATINLKHPIKAAGCRMVQITMRRPTVGDCIAAKIKPGTADPEGEARLMARLCGMIWEDFALIDMEDYAAMQEALLSFLGGGNVVTPSEQG